ncbi:MAG TPA: aspartate aminotransferase family protein [Solirubrobacteraceae bacterium]|nr:aspartate aminotransferase family protein [Solirubrobacteraceae bacterium]
MRAPLSSLLAEERARFAVAHPRSAAAHAEATPHLLGGVPMPWMAKWAGGFPVYLAEAHGARVVDLDGHEYADLCLGDTGAMAGHSPGPTVDAVRERLETRGGATVMLPTEDAAWVGADLARRFGLPQWQFTLTATDANRFALRFCRQLTGRRKVLVFSWCYHGSVDETFVVLEDGRPRAREGLVGAAVDPTETTAVVEFNDLPALEAALTGQEIACVLAEPALTNIGIVLPEPGFWDGVRAACSRTGTLLIIDETHTLSAGPGGCTRAWGLEPDLVTLGKAIGGGVPIGAYGVSKAVAERMAADTEGDYEDAGGVGGTLAGNALSLAAARATLADVLTADAFARMTALQERFTAGVRATIARHGLPWCVVELGARAEYRFAPEPPRTGAESAAVADTELEDYLHLAVLNRGVLITPFHNMALMSPATTEAEVDRHTEAFADAVAALVS